VAQIYLSRLLVVAVVVVAVAVFAQVVTVDRAVARALYLAVVLVRVYLVRVMQVVRFMTRAVAVLLLVVVAVKALSGRKVILLADSFMVATAVTGQHILAFTMQAVAVHQCKTHHKALLTAKAV
jgi:hypothetical protein